MIAGGGGPVWRYRTDPRIETLEAARFTAVHAGLVAEEPASVRWLVIGAVMAAQAACVAALGDAGAEDEALRRNPSALLKRVSDPRVLSPPFALAAAPAEVARFKQLAALRNRFAHPPAGGWSLDLHSLPGLVAPAVKAVRHLAVVQPTAPGAHSPADAAALSADLDHIDAAMAFWSTTFDGAEEGKADM